MNKNLIDRFLNDRYSDEDKRLVFKWLVDSKREHETNAFLKKHWESVDKYRTLVDSNLNAIYQCIIEAIDDEKIISLINRPMVVPKERRHFVVPLFIKYVAIMLVAFCLSYIVWNQNSKLSPSKEIATIQKITSRGQKSHLILSDNSKVILNSGSKLIYDSEYGKTNRNLTLIGEAFFDVVKNEDLPFTVTAGNTVTKALGTSFNISSYGETALTAISLITGKLRITSTHADELPTVILNSGEQLQLDTDISTGLVRNFDIASVISWKDNILLFENADISEMITDLERWYNVDVVLLNSKKTFGIRATGKFENESLENILRVLSYSLKFDYQINNDSVTISFN